MADTADLKSTPLTSVHVRLGARMVPFAGYSMPVQYAGVLAEHTQCRTKAALFDVSHMGQARMVGPDAALAVERITCLNARDLKPGRQAYTLLLNASGGIDDDLMVSRPDENGLFLVVNASEKAEDFAKFAAASAGLDARLEVITDSALVALQGPQAGHVLERLAPELNETVFMDARTVSINGIAAIVTRSGYTGEDGFEISVADKDAEGLWTLLTDQPEVEPAGLGARDSLRLEAGLCLYGHDINTQRSPVEANLRWAVKKARREAADFPGAERILKEWAEGTDEVLVGLKGLDRAPAREGTPVLDAGGDVIGTLTSGGPSPTAGYPIALAYVRTEHAREDTRLILDVRGKHRPAEVVSLPFVPHRYKRSAT